MKVNRGWLLQISFRHNSHTNFYALTELNNLKVQANTKRCKLSQLVVAEVLVSVLPEHLELVLLVFLSRILFILKLPGLYEADKRVKLSLSCTKYWLKDHESLAYLIPDISAIFRFGP